MIIIETCPKCGHDLECAMVCTYPPIPTKTCYNCGWHWEGEREGIIRVPFDEGGKFNTDTSLDISLFGNIDNEFIKRGYSEEDSKILANIAERAAVSYNGVTDITEAVSGVVSVINGDYINMKKLSDLK